MIISGPRLEMKEGRRHLILAFLLSDGRLYIGSCSSCKLIIELCFLLMASRIVLTMVCDVQVREV